MSTGLRILFHLRKKLVQLKNFPLLPPMEGRKQEVAEISKHLSTFTCGMVGLSNKSGCFHRRILNEFGSISK